MPLRYEGDVFRPPSEANSLILQATIGCSHNRCTFCGMYKRKKFRVRSLEQISSDIALAAAYMPRTRRVFLADGNALTMETNSLLKVLSLLGQAFPNLQRVTLYGNPQDLLEKSSDELLRLKKSGLGMIYLGLESGSAAVLNMVKKGVSPDQVVEGAGKAKEAGVPLSITVINGLAGVEGSEEHAVETARLLIRIDPEYLGLLSLMTVPGTTMYRQFQKGALTALNPWQLLREIRLVVEGLELTNCVFRANHASNYLPLKATLSKEKKELLFALDSIIRKKTPGSLKSELLRGL